MQYRRFGRLDWQASALGFGTMRLPLLGEDSAAIDEDRAIAMIRHAIDRGVNYLDSAYPYHGGNSERVVGKALRNGYRRKVRVATKLPCWDVRTRDDFDRLLDEQCARLQVDCIDVYLLHNLQAPFWKRMLELGALEWLDRVRSAGRVGQVGFSFHDRFDVLKAVVDGYDGWTVCQVQYNYMNEDVQGGTRGVEYAAAKGLAVVVMEPLLGGCLASPPDAVRALYAASGRNWSPAEWALQWLWNRPDVATVLSGMSAPAQVEENLVAAGRSGVGSLRAADLEVVAQARRHYESLHLVPCTRCGYCLPCPQGVDIPRNLQLYNDALVFQGNQKLLNGIIYSLLPESARAAACVACHACEKKCTQKIPISEWMPKVRAHFEAKA